MSDTAHSSPVRYSSDVETIPEGEADAIRGLGEQVKAIQDKTAADYGTAIRGIHAKGHAIVSGTLAVMPDLPPELAQGLFATAGSYEALLRFSTLPGDILDDSVSVPRGLGLKILGVTGERLPGSESDETQDFVLVNGPAFASATPKTFLANLKLLAASTDRAEGFKKAFSATMQTIDAALETVGIASPTVQTLGGAPQTHPAGETYYSQVPIRYGDYIAKVSVAPVSANLTDLTGSKVDTSGRPDALREDMRETLIEQDSVWELRVQLCTDLKSMPIEDASAVWDEKASPYRAVARLTVPAQLGWENGVSNAKENGTAFSPWHGVAAFRPLGGINRSRRPVYEQSVAYRGSHNGCPIHEPRSLADVPSHGPTID
jgi:hypothetical protein